MLADKKIVVVDVDGVLLNIHSVVEEIMKEDEGFIFNHEDVLSYEYNDWLLGYIVSKEIPLPMDRLRRVAFIEQKRRIILSKYNKKEIFEVAYFYRDAMRHLRAIMELPNVLVKFNTMCSTKEIAEIKERRIRGYFADVDPQKYEFVFTIATGGIKPLVEGADYIIDDYPKNFKPYADKNPNVRCYLVDKSYNQNLYNPEYEDIEKKFKSYTRGGTEADTLYAVWRDITAEIETDRRA